MQMKATVSLIGVIVAAALSLLTLAVSGLGFGWFMAWTQAMPASWRPFITPALSVLAASFVLTGVIWRRRRAK